MSTLLTDFSIRRDRRLLDSIIVAICFGYALLITILVPPGEFTPDSPQYLDFAPFRSAGYPLFLDVILGVGLGLEGVYAIQAMIAAAGYAVLGVTIGRYTHGWLGLLVALAAMMNPQAITYPRYIMTEALFTAFLCFMLAAMIAWIVEGRARDMVAIGVCIGLAMAVRPSSIALLPMLPLVALARCFLGGGRTGRHLLYGFAAVFALIAAETLTHRAYHGDNKQSLLSFHVFGRGLLLEPVAADPSEPERAAFIAEIDAATAPVREMIAGAPDSVTRQYVSQRYEVLFQLRYLRDELQEHAAAQGLTMREVMFDIGIDRILADPAGYLRISLSHYRFLWFPYSHIGYHEQINGYLDVVNPLPLIGDYLDHWPDAQPIVEPLPLFIRYGLQTVFVLIWMLTIAAPFAALIAIRRQWPRRLTLTYAALVGLAINGVFLFTGLTGVSVQRYTLGMWPAICVFALMTLLLLAQSVKLLPRDEPEAR